jgi:hypothetical protein
VNLPIPTLAKYLLEMETKVLWGKFCVTHWNLSLHQVARDPNPDSGVSLNPIEIPPPRPKKKPLHPYPRKVVDSQKTGVADSNQNEQSLPPNLTGEERDTRSPTSVLSAIGSDTSGSPFSELQKSSHLSPTSCTSEDAHSANVMLVENENECMTSNSCVEEEKGSLQSTQVYPTRMDAKPLTVWRQLF